MTIEDIQNDNKFNDGKHEEIIIKVVGVGGGGNNAITHMFKQNIKDVTFAIINTDRQALNSSPVHTRLMIGPTVTKGLGAGNIPDRARAAAEESEEDIKDLLSDDTQMVFITAGMGGGTGTGAAPVVARIAKEMGILTIGIVTIPFLFEGRKKILKALEGAQEMAKNVDALLVINNESLTEIYPEVNLDNGFALADDTLTVAARSIAELITTPGRINVDFNDVDTTLRNGGAAIISTGYGEGPNRVSQAIEDALNSPLLKNRNILSSKRLLFNLYYSRDAGEPFVMSEASELTNFISSIDTGEVDVIWGLKYDESLENRVKITILAAGFDDIDEAAITGRKPAAPAAAANPKVEINPRHAATVSATPDARQKDDHLQRIMSEQYGSDKLENLQRQKERQTHIILSPDQIDDDAIVEALERMPAYNRDKKITTEINRGAASPAAGRPAESTRPSTGTGSSTATLDFMMDE